MAKKILKPLKDREQLVTKLWVCNVPTKLLEALEVIRVTNGWNKQVTMGKVIESFINASI